MTNAFLFLLLILGHATLWITFVNRSHAWPLHHETLRRLRHLHDVMLPLFPVVLVVALGLTGPELLRRGSWKNVPAPWWPYFLACAGGVLWLGCVLFRILTHRSPRQLLQNHSRRFDIAADLGRPLLADGSYHWMATWPGNEQFCCELNDKTLQLARLPESWNGLTILHLSDWHLTGTVHRDYFIRVSELARETECDLVCFTGDLLDKMDLIDWLPETLGTLTARLGRYFILGNHDWYQRPQEIRSRLEALGWQDVSSRTEPLNIEGKRLEIGGDETPWMGQPPKFSPAADFRLLLSHTPDHLPQARRNGVDLMLSGHVHGGQVQLPLLGPVYAPSRYGCRYAAGTFFEAPTLLHVSRGLSGQHPFRWNCLPEVTRLILRGPDEEAAPAGNSPS